jgi:hypothetical protein
LDLCWNAREVYDNDFTVLPSTVRDVSPLGCSTSREQPSSPPSKTVELSAESAHGRDVNTTVPAL